MAFCALESVWCGVCLTFCDLITCTYQIPKLTYQIPKLNQIEKILLTIEGIHVVWEACLFELSSAHISSNLTINEVEKYDNG